MQAGRVPQAEEPSGTRQHLLIFRLHGGKSHKEAELRLVDEERKKKNLR